MNKNIQAFYYPLKRKHKVAAGIIILVVLLFYFSLPNTLFSTPKSSVIESSTGELLGAKIAPDGQWRFPANDSIPYKLKVSLQYFEDEYFYKHLGINPIALVKALRNNFVAGRIVGGGSTISMQTIRLSRGKKSRNIYQKCIEMVLALRLELRYSKEEILNLYASNTPYGGNVVGVEAASWRYFNRPANELSWGEASMLAVLPNAPSLLYPGKNSNALLKKRNRLLDKLLRKKIIDSITNQLAKEEPIPTKPNRLPQHARHLLQRSSQEGYEGKRLRTTINFNLQQLLNRKVSEHNARLATNEIQNLAAIVLDTKTGAVLAYTGNAPCSEFNNCYVDIISSPRSTGSIMKPFLYAAMLDDGVLLPQMLVSDIPTHISGYAPKNFNKSFDGAVPASNALARSLNIPAIRMLRRFGLEKFLHLTKQLRISTINQNADHYGLSIILGGAEATLWDLTGIYASMARSLVYFERNSARYDTDSYRKPSYIPLKNEVKQTKESTHGILSAGAIYLTFEALKSLNRPDGEIGWERFVSSRKIGWKTGTSFGHRDAWSIGVTPEYTVGIWVGNADGEGRPGLTGLSSAAPIMFDVFNALPSTTWFNTPYDDLVDVNICEESGYRAGPNCNGKTTLVQLNGLKAQVCTFHVLVHLDKEKRNRVSSSCYPVKDMATQNWFVLPPTQEYYFKKRNANYKSLPPFKQACNDARKEDNIEIIYPRHNTKVYVPKGLDGIRQKLIFEAVHRQESMKLFWHLNDVYLATTSGKHQIEYLPEIGKHYLTLVDETGNSFVIQFEVLEK